MTARHHHYLSQCYLKGFTKGGAKKSKLTIYDLKERKRFETIPRNVGGLRDFNRVDIEGVDQNAIEKSLADFERAAASALRDLEENHTFEGETKTLILNLIALLAIRSPEMREQWRKFHQQIAEKVMDLSLVTKERWEAQMKQMKEDGGKVNDNLSYEDIKEFHESKRYEFKVAREYHIHMEFTGVEAILPCLESRNWLLIKTNEETGPFITTDNPVNLTWKEPDEIPPFYQNSPGYGMKDTQVYFPVSKNIALIGEFDGNDGVIEGNRELIRLCNTKMLMFCYRQVYSPKNSFYFRGRDGEELDGTQLFRHMYQ